MKSEYFNKRSQTTQLRGHREKPKPKQINWDRIVYFVLLILILGFLSYYLFLNTFYVSGEGLVVSETVKVRAPSDIEVREQLISRNSVVEKGEPLFRYTPINWTDRKMDEIDKLQENLSDKQEEIEDLQDDITLKRQSIEEIQDRIDYLEKERENFQEKVRLNAATSYELDEVENSLFSARSNLRQAQTELNVLRNNLNRHIQVRASFETDIQQIRSGESEVQTYYSPVSGRVLDIFTSENQQAFRSDQIVSIKPTQADVYIFSVFDREDAEYIQPGTVMNIEFDNGEESEGVIRSSYDARENLIDHFEQTGSLTTEYFVVEVVPLNAETRTQWLELDRSGLDIYRKKVGASEVSPPDRTVNTSNDNIISADQFDEQSESISDSTSIQSSTPSASETSSSLDEEPEEPVANIGVSDEQGNSAPQYGLMGDSFYDQLDGYSINLYTFKDQEKASTTSEQIRKEGFRVGVQAVTIRDQDMWRVSVGQFKTIEDAQTAAESLPSSIAGDYFINRIQ